MPKPRKMYKEGDLWINLLTTRRLSQRVAKAFEHTSVTPNELTFVSLVSILAAALCFASGDYWLLVLGAVFLQLHLVFDCADGDLARLKKTCSAYGRWLDGVVDNVGTSAVIFGAAWASFNAAQDYAVWAWAFAALFGCFLAKLSYFTGLLLFKPEKRGKAREEKSVKGVLYTYVFGFSYWFQILLFTLAAILNQLFAGIVIMALWSNLTWAGRFAKFHSKRRELG